MQEFWVGSIPTGSIKMKWLAVMAAGLLLVMAYRGGGEDLSEKVLLVHRLRLEAAEIDLKADESEAEYRKGRYVRLKAMARTGAATESSVVEAKYLWERAAFEVEMSRNFVAESRARMDLAESAVKSGRVAAEELRFAAEPRQRRK